jgi:ribosomal protein S27AE
MLERNPDNRRRIARDSYHRRKLAKPARAWPAKPYDAKTKARRKLQAEVRAGRIVRQPCEACGKPAAHAHHDDYSKPLEVRWLCPLCHAAAHRLD